MTHLHHFLLLFTHFESYLNFFSTKVSLTRPLVFLIYYLLLLLLSHHFETYSRFFRPTFKEALKLVKIPESTPTGSFVAQFETESTEEVSYSLKGADSSDFSIDAELGIVKVEKPLDFEKKKRYSITVIATGAGQQLTSEAKLVVEVGVFFVFLEKKNKFQEF